MEHPGRRLLESQSSTSMLNRELRGIINLCLWNVLNTSGSNYCCAYSHSYINICTCKISAPWHLLKWLPGKMRQIDSGVGSQNGERQSFVNATTTSGVANTQKPGPDECVVGAGSANAIFCSLSRGIEHAFWVYSTKTIRVYACVCVCVKCEQTSIFPNSFWSQWPMLPTIFHLVWPGIKKRKIPGGGIYGTEVRPNSYSKVHLQDFTRHAGSSEILNHAVTILNLSLKNMVTIWGLSSVINKCLYATQNFCLSFCFFSAYFSVTLDDSLW